jgi:hypothetical protein
MIADKQNEYSHAQALTVTADSTNEIDHGADNDIGVGEEMAVVLTLDVAAKSSDANETYTAVLKVGPTSGGETVQVGNTVTITKGDAAGTQYVIAIPKDFNFDRFSKLVYTLGGTNPSVTVTAALVPNKNIPAYKAYPRGFTIS